MKKSSLKKILLVGMLVLALVFGIKFYFFDNSHIDNTNKPPAFEMTAISLIQKFTSDEKMANIKFGNKLIKVSGKIVEQTITKHEISVFLEDKKNGVHCVFNKEVLPQLTEDFTKRLAIGKKITLKGKCDGKDRMMGIILSRCILLEE